MSDTHPTPTLAALFLNFFTIGLCGFGGVGPWARRMVVEQRRWMSAAEFTVMNLTIALGARFHGIPGAIAAFLGLMTGPVAIVIGLGAIYDQYAGLPAVRHAFAALAAAASALVIANALKIAEPLRKRPLAAAVATVTFVTIALLRLPLLAALPVLALASTALLWRFGR